MVFMFQCYWGQVHFLTEQTVVRGEPPIMIQHSIVPCGPVPVSNKKVIGCPSSQYYNDHSTAYYNLLSNFMYTTKISITNYQMIQLYPLLYPEVDVQGCWTKSKQNPLKYKMTLKKDLTVSRNKTCSEIQEDWSFPPHCQYEHRC